MSTILTEGALLAERYQLGPVLGVGGMGEVRTGRDLRLGREVAVKLLRADLASRPEVRRRFEGEGRAAARLCHFHVVSVHDVGEYEGVPYLVMERVAGPNLAEEMARGPLEPARVRRLGADILGALAAAHAAGIVHCDVKPGNVLLTAEGSAKVTDFGIARAVDEEGVDLTETGSLAGTAAYMAPERLAGQPATVAADLYSVGVVLHEALTGRRPDRAGGQLPAHLGPALVATIERALAPRPEDRFASAAEMAAALRMRSPAEESAPTVETDALTAVLTSAPAAPPAGVGHRPRRTTYAVVAAALVGGLLALAGAGLVGHARPASSPPSSTVAPPATPALPPGLEGALHRLEETLR